MAKQPNDFYYMGMALAEAKRAFAEDEVPVGAIVVCRGAVVGFGHNQREGLRDATAHAEMLALRMAMARLGGWRLPGATLYVTLEPCPMCAGALVQARIARLVYATADRKSGAAGSVVELCQNPQLNHQVEVDSGPLAAEAAALLRAFFQRNRK